MKILSHPLSAILTKKVAYVMGILSILLLTYYFLQPKNTGRGSDLNTRYQLVNLWPNLPYGTLGSPVGLAIDTSRNIVVYHRAERKWPFIGPMPAGKIPSKTIFVLNRHDGKILNSWGANLFIMPHGLTVDENNNIWVTDVGLHQVFKFSHNGQLLMKVGVPGLPGNDSFHFNQPTDVAVAKNGSFYVSDGYGNSRIMKFSPGGKFLFEWGKKGKEAGEFNIPHGLATDDKEHIYVADRENRRIQIFDSSGRYLSEFTNKNLGNIYAVAWYEPGQKLILVDDVTFLKVKHLGSNVLITDLKGKIQTRFGRSGDYQGSICWYHDVVIDDDECIYAGDILGNRIQKFKKVSVRLSLEGTK